MAATDILLGRGVVSLGGDDVGLCSSLSIRHEVKQVAIATWDSTPIGGAAEIARRTRVYIDLSIHEMTAGNRAKLLDLVGDPDDVALVWSGHNAMAANCLTSTWTLTVPNFCLIPVENLPLIVDNLEDALVQVSGEALRASGSASWYTLSSS